MKKYIKLIDQLTESDSIRQTMKRNIYTTCSLVILESFSNLYKYQLDQFDSDNNHLTESNKSASLFKSIDLNILLNDYFSNAIQMLEHVFKTGKPSSNSIHSNDLTIARFDQNESYSSLDLFTMINNSLKAMGKRSFFSIILNSFRYINIF